MGEVLVHSLLHAFVVVLRVLPSRDAWSGPDLVARHASKLQSLAFVLDDTTGFLFLLGLEDLAKPLAHAERLLYVTSRRGLVSVRLSALLSKSEGLCSV